MGQKLGPTQRRHLSKPSYNYTNACLLPLKIIYISLKKNRCKQRMLHNVQKQQKLSHFVCVIYLHKFDIPS